MGVYLQQGKTDKAFDFKSVPLATATSEEKPAPGVPQQQGGNVLKHKPMMEPAKKAAAKEVSFADEVIKIPELARIPFGGLFKSCEKQQLTESETEYVVSCTKHVFAQHLLLQVGVVCYKMTCIISN